MALMLPPNLMSTATESVQLPSGGVARLPKAAPVFHRWRGPPPGDVYGGKELLDFEGRPAFAELVILWTLQSAGWSGAWVDTYRHRFRSGYWGDAPDVVLPNGPDALLETIYTRAGRRTGAFDVIVWQGDQMLFAESKRKGKDRIRDSQRRWLSAAIEVGVALDHLLVVEWDLEGGGGQPAR